MFARMTLRDATFSLLQKLRTIYDEGEASSITELVMETLTGSTRTERMLYKHAELTTGEETRLAAVTQRLLNHEPVQYVLNEAWFGGMRFYVDEQVLIPRPETEELVNWMIAEIRSRGKTSLPLKILDIGTGSGCIPVTLKVRVQDAEIWSCDKSEQAMDVARRNAAAMDAGINFRQLDFLDREQRILLPTFDMIISNPPYIPETDRNTLAPNVRNYEPSMALFVPDNDPLVFYRAIAEFGSTHLAPGGVMFMEIHEDRSRATEEIFRSAGFVAESRKDMQGKQRMLKVLRSS